ncbi:hypothetical protein BJ875DRAFT_166661 [Amylocarpus encephaloides]|uniref:Uncharacterized protein n=1 Tax=Amylocarpus encephaloides TaxID=45428 RepID=A0A9P8C1A3_9HELO|nr:hypothetical protein BJ875DRAFT_166661 [Amylocarpus encephaloides]
MSKQMATVSSAGDAVPFEAACSLSSGLVILAGIRIYGYFQPAQGRPWQLAISSISFASSASTLGMVFSKTYRRHEGVHLGLLLWNSGILGMCEAECLLVLLGKLHPRLLKGFYWILAVLWLLMVVGFICIAVQHRHSQSIWIVLLSAATGAVYILLCIGYTILCSQSMATTTRVLLLCLAAPCPFPLIVSASLLGRNAAGSISGRLVLSAWVISHIHSFGMYRLN